ncbi:S-layer homology domain-containing protein [Paenibacillus anaericanus]|uniref:S-layer homology domain-containing protein n=1 Tax=Paenibacillus anaericanus TaxID=170367 RepID=A0A433YAA4_9BACL|nr:S-layer homology domain-containing protein [Paenibacillus anaericanus]RUT46789.1 S-layer homology domain-containing protein [Paenibacillus anaericanus]
MNKFMVGGISGVMLFTVLFGTVYSVQAAEKKGTSPSIALETQQAAESSVQKTQDARNFTDVRDGHWAKTDIVTAVSKGYVAGYPGGLFKPDQPIKRGEFVKMVVTALGLPVETTTGAWYESYVKVAGDNILYSTSDFANNDKEWNTNITRQEMARIAVRATGATTTEDDKWMYLATKAGLITGLGKGELGIDKTTTRAQSVTIIERILTVKDGGTLPVDKYAVGSAEIAWHGTNIFTVMPEIYVTDEKDYVGKTIEDLWNEELMVLETKDGDYKGVLEALIAIDLADPNDPNLKLLPPLSELKWFNRSGVNDGVPMEQHPVSEKMDSYLLYYKGKEIYNNNSARYRSSDLGPSVTLMGMNAVKLTDMRKGILNMPAIVYHHKLHDLPVDIVPKTGWVQNGDKLKIEIHSPSVVAAGYTSHILLEVNGPMFD